MRHFLAASCHLFMVFHNYLEQPDGTVETPHSYLPYNSVIEYREISGMDAKNFEQWAHSFVEQTDPLTNTNNYVLLSLDSYGA